MTTIRKLESIKAELVPDDPDKARRDQQAREWRDFLEQQIQEKRDREVAERRQREREDETMFREQRAKDERTRQHIEAGAAHTSSTADHPAAAAPAGSSTLTGQRLRPRDLAGGCFSDPMTDSQAQITRPPHASTLLRVQDNAYKSSLPRPTFLLQIRTTAADAAGLLRPVDTDAIRKYVVSEIGQETRMEKLASSRQSVAAGASPQRGQYNPRQHKKPVSEQARIHKEALDQLRQFESVLAAEQLMVAKDMKAA
nr:hypothetical protein HK105_007910 [Polyrhizophydium stewartii]